MNKMNFIKPFLAAIISTVCFLASNLHLHANDASWGYDETISNLVLLQQEDIAMVSEELYISLDKIEVKYVFENRSDKDISTIVGFPFANGMDRPPCKDQECKELVLNGEEHGSYFEVWVNDEQVETNDRSSENYNKISYWQQVFPAKKQIRIRHTYEPDSYGSPYGLGVPNRDYCSTPKIDEVVKAANLINETIHKGITVNENYINYILTTGGYWAGGKIGDFKLFIDTKEEGVLVSICGFDLTKTGPTTYEWQQKNFRPTKDLYILFFGGTFERDRGESR